MTNERWAPIEGFPDYEISDAGRVRRLTSRTCGRAGALLKTPPRSAARPYPVVDLCRDGRRRTCQVHRLVAAAFLGAAPPGACEVNHINGNKSDPRAGNLEWCTPSHNRRHAYAAGLSCAAGEKNGQAVLTEDQVRAIRDAFTGRRGQVRAMARMFNVSHSTVSNIVRRLRWAHL